MGAVGSSIVTFSLSDGPYLCARVEILVDKLCFHLGRLGAFWPRIYESWTHQSREMRAGKASATYEIWGKVSALAQSAGISYHKAGEPE
jgi:hypothetical protein